MIITTTHAIAGREIAEYLDIVSAESVQGINVVRDVFAGMRDFFGGRSQTLERALKEARVQATDEIKERARDIRADAVIGLDYEISMPSGRGGMVVVLSPAPPSGSSKQRLAASHSLARVRGFLCLASSARPPPGPWRSPIKRPTGGAVGQSGVFNKREPL